MIYETKKNGMTIEELLRNEWGLGKKIVHELRMAKCVKDSTGQEPDWKTPLEAGTLLQIELPAATSPYAAEPRNDVPIVFEDEHLLIALKPKGMPTHPNEIGQKGTLANAVLGHLAETGTNYAEHVHRLDQGTSGLVLFAKHPVAKNVLDRMLEQRQIAREYEAEVAGSVKQPAGTIEEAIGRDRHHPTRRRVSPSGQPAVTHYRTVRRNGDRSTLHLTLDTGRTHQIRVHLSHLGYPIIGDELYGGPATADGTYKLHAFRISFVHPFTGEKIKAEAK